MMLRPINTATAAHATKRTRMIGRKVLARRLRTLRRGDIGWRNYEGRSANCKRKVTAKNEQTASATADLGDHGP